MILENKETQMLPGVQFSFTRRGPDTKGSLSLSLASPLTPQLWFRSGSNVLVRRDSVLYPSSAVLRRPTYFRVSRVTFYRLDLTKYVPWALSTTLSPVHSRTSPSTVDSTLQVI